ncbi:hypothetical protein Trydic_g13747 [Trypoxylus dichotomus]
MSKAFDRIDHGILLHKFRSFGFSDPPIILMSSYLIGRRFYVSSSGFESAEGLIPLGVLQGSIEPSSPDMTTIKLTEELFKSMSEINDTDAASRQVAIDKTPIS